MFLGLLTPDQASRRMRSHASLSGIGNRRAGKKRVAPGSGYTLPREWWMHTAEGSGWKVSWARAPRFSSRCPSR